MTKYLIYLNNYDIRPCKAQYLYWYLNMLEKFPDALFVLNKDYLNPDPNRWEIRDKKKANKNWVYKVPKNYVLLPKIEEMEDVKRRDFQNPASFLKLCVNQHITDLDEALDKIINENKIEAAFTCVNNKTLENVCFSYNIPVIHNEQGPLRPPFFHGTVYLDFSGVNGRTEFYSRFLNFQEMEVELYSKDELLRIVTKPEQYSYVSKLVKAKPIYDCGVALQVDVDTNMIAYNNGWTSADLINKAMKEHGRVLIRNHPLASMQYASNTSLGNGVIDKSANSLEFISKCKKIVTINSSVAFEAMLLGREVEILGDSPFAAIPKMDEETKLVALNFAIFGYLIPDYLWGDKEYFKFRIFAKNEEIVYNKNMKYKRG